MKTTKSLRTLSNGNVTTATFIKPQKRLISISKLDLVFNLKLSDEFIVRHRVNFSSIETVSNLISLIKANNLFQEVTLTSPNVSLNFLLFFNKTDRAKCFIDLISMSSFTLSKEASEIREELIKIIEANSISLNNSDNSFSPGSISFKLRTSNAEKVFSLSPEGTQKKAPTPSVSTSNFNLTNDTQNSHNDIYSDESKMNKFFSYLNSFDFADYDYLYFDMEDFASSKVTVNMMDLLYTFLNNIKTTSGISIITNFLFINFVGENGTISGEILKKLIDLFEFTDIYIFDKKDSFHLFSTLNIIKKDNKSKKELQKSEIYSFFSNCIVKKTNLSFSKKFAFFIDSLNQATFIEMSKGKNDVINTVNCQLYPKPNHTNYKKIFSYKVELENNYNLYFGIFTGTLIGRFIRNPSLSSEYLSIATLIALDITKKILEIKKNNYDLPANQNFYLVSIPRNRVIKEMNAHSNRKKEEKFVLDCLNKANSSIRGYNALRDKNLHLFFSSEVTRKRLISQGLIDSNGFIMKHSLAKSKSDLRRPLGGDRMPSEKAFIEAVTQLKVWENPDQKEIDFSQVVPNRTLISSEEKLPQIKKQFLNGCYSTKILRRKNKSVIRKNFISKEKKYYS